MNAPLPNEEEIDAFAARLGEHLRRGGTLAEWVGADDADLEALYAAAWLFYDRDDYDTALRLYGLLLMANPYDRRFAIGMGMCKQMLKQYDDAIGYYANALVLDFDDPLPSFHTAECLVQKGLRNEALQALELCISRAKAPEHKALLQKASELQRLLLASSKPTAASPGARA